MLCRKQIFCDNLTLAVIGAQSSILSSYWLEDKMLSSLFLCYEMFSRVNCAQFV